MDGYEGIFAGEVRALPDAADGEPVELGVEADDGDVEREGLGGDDAVEWVAVVGGEAAGAEGGFGADGKQCIACFVDCFKKAPFQGFGCWEFAEAHFGGDLPGRGCGYKDFVFLIGDEGGGLVAERCAGE